MADTYNDKIKIIDPEARTSRTLVGGEGQFFEPGGLDYADGRLYIADTNHHVIRAYDLRAGRLTEFVFKQ